MSRPYVTISINNEIHEDRIILNKEKLLSIKTKDLYYWHYEIVRSVITDLKLI